jgi:hypothetical protein
MIVAILPAMKSKKIPTAQKIPVSTLNGAKPVAWDLKTSKFRPRQIKMAECCNAHRPLSILSKPERAGTITTPVSITRADGSGLSKPYATQNPPVLRVAASSLKMSLWYCSRLMLCFALQIILLHATA